MEAQPVLYGTVVQWRTRVAPAHISVGGAIATGTPVRRPNPSLVAAVSALDLVCADGSIRSLRRGDADFDGAVVGLGALGLVARMSLDVVPAFELRQYVFEELPWQAVDANLDEILAGGYSVSLFTTWTELGVEQVWVKTSEDLGRRSSYFGARPATVPRNRFPVRRGRTPRSSRRARPVG